MPFFRKKPVVIEAEQWFSEGGVHTADILPCCGGPTTAHKYIQTLEGEMRACSGDWIITGVEGEVYPCKPDIFDKTYEKVEE